MKKLTINKAILTENIHKIKTHTESQIIATLKNNGYGLGLDEYPKILLENGIDFFAVSTIEEAKTLRNNGFTNKIMLLHSTALDEDIKTLIENNIIITVGSFDALEAVIKNAKEKTDIQIKIDTGFGRFGFLPSELEDLAEKLKNTDKLNIVGTFSHFSMSFNSSKTYTQKQFNKFKKSVKTLNKLGIETGILHICNSSAFIKYKEMHLDAVRVGSAFLGRILVENELNLTKIGTLVSKIEDTKTLPKGHFIGYSNTKKVKHETNIGIIPVGYLDGFCLKKSLDCFRLKDILREMYGTFKMFRKKLYVTVGHKKAPILGKIGTNNIVIELNDSININDDVYLEINPMLVTAQIPREFV